MSSGSSVEDQPLSIEGVSGVYSLTINAGTKTHTMLITKQ